jgi:ABC-type multidrug transport system permease subunit
MDEEMKIPSLITELLRRVGIIFLLTILVVSAAGMLVNRYDSTAGAESTLFALTGGLTYNIIFQITGFSLIIAIFSVLLFSEYFQIKIRFLLRGLLLLLTTLGTTSVFAVLFKWFPPNSIQSWLGFIICTVICFAISFALTYLKLKLEIKKYGKLLAEYKLRNDIN